jgi:FMN phosphatase YigB (HAD superfamily)
MTLAAAISRPSALRVVSRRAFVFDIDGTLADGTHRIHHILKHPKDWDAYFAAAGEDTLIRHVAEVLDALYGDGYPVVYVTGRPEDYRAETQSWLDRHGLPVTPLYMRPSGDHRDDDVVKVELLGRMRADGYEPVMVFEDRSRVVRALRAVGVNVAQVADGDF